MNNTRHHERKQNIFFLAKHKEPMRKKILRMTNKGLPAQLSYAMLKKLTGPPVGEVATCIK